ncbi:capsule biosynthesis protein [Paracoccus contaminans]|uniref:Capsule biosynthesis protein n=1 Tax=Paracoccus contaminans TaxID=1945662 RepID=A0A1W6CU92_9RHOB|nr:capsule biosynthesis protein [Paracoccus contaminans]ARJ68424.1 capsule biosynthesis protein [Paracoccus contaminans]
MTTPPKVRRFHLSAAESPLSAARAAAQGEAPAPAAPRQSPARPAVRVEIQRGAQAAQTSAQPQAPHDEAPQGAGAHAAEPADIAAMLGAADDGFGAMRFPGAAPHPDAAAPGARDRKGGQPPAGRPAPDDAARIAAVRAENLTSRQLRLAARIAAMHGIEAASEHEAVLRLRDKGIDPFHRGAVGRILANAGNAAQSAPSPQAPATVPAPSLPARARRKEIAPIAPDGLPARPQGPALPSREALTEERRAAEIYRIQRDIAKRRRRNFSWLMARLAFFVGLPTLIAGWYYLTQATPLYATTSQFLIQQADAGGGGELGGMFRGTQLATNPDSVSVQSYLTSRDAMRRLDQELGFTRAFQDPSIDPLKRLSGDATMEQAYAVYQDSVKIGYDPTEGVINMEVIAPDPKLSEQFSLALIRYAEGQVDQMTARLRDDQMKGAIETYNDAERKVQEAQARVQALQERLGVLDPTAEGSVVMSQISALEGELSKKRLELGQLLANARPNQSRVAGTQGDISRLEQLIADTRAKLTQDQGNRASLAAISGELRIAEGDLATRQQLLAAAAGQMETARVEANKQVRYLSLSVAPVPPDEATYPKALQNTIVAFLVFSGIYLMMSLTASILREQVSS